MNLKEQLLSDIIDDARKKGSSIYGWQYSQNGKVIILRNGKVPEYCINLFQAMDLLIHRYNLVKKYRYIYTPNRTFDRRGFSERNEATSQSYTLEEKAIQLCDAIVFHPMHPFNVDAQNKIYHAIHKANETQHLNQDDFLMLRSRLSEHYTNRQFSSDNAKEKEKLRKVIHFFEKMKYKDFIELF